MDIVRDFRFGVRAMRRNATLTLVAVSALAVGIGLNTAVFTLVNAVLFKGLPFHDSEEIVHLNSLDIPTGQLRGVSFPDLKDWRDQTSSFQGLAAFFPTSTNLSDDRRFPESVTGTRVTPNLFSVVGQPVLRGRGFLPEDGKADAPPVAIIGEGLWQSRYGADPDILGKEIRANGIRFTIVGIMPRGMEFPNNSRIWFVLRDGPEFESRASRSLQVVGRLKDGVSLEKAEAEMTGVTARLAGVYPETNKNFGVGIRTSSEYYNGGDIRIMFFALMGAVTFVLLIACANVANLLLAQALRRGGETAIRSAIGAGRWRLIRQSLTESFMLSLAGAAIGVCLAYGGVFAFDRAVSSIQGKPYWIDFSLDLTVFAYLAAISVGTAVLFGMVPALQASKINIIDALKDGGRSTSAGSRSRRWTGALVIAELSLTVVLLVGAGLMFRSFLNLQRVDLGADTDGVVMAQVLIPVTGYEETASRVAFSNRLVERLNEVGALQASALTSNPPGSGSGNQVLSIPGRDLTGTEGRPPMVPTVSVSPGYFETFSLPVLRGRTFTDADGGEGAQVAIVNAAFVQQYWPGEDPLEKTIRLGPVNQGNDDNQDNQDNQYGAVRIVGIVPTVRQNVQPGAQSGGLWPVVYVPFRQRPTNFLTIVARGNAGTAALVSGIRTALSQVDPDLPAANPRTYEQWLAERTWPFQVFGGVFAIAALIALVLSSAGIFGVTAYAVDQRTQEIGVRVALGASAGNILWLVSRSGVRQLLVGLALGTAGAFALARVLGEFMFDVGTSDPVTLIAVNLLLTAVTAAACFFPAKRATRLDPLEAIRFE